ncbi:nucleoside-diphosphate kinase [Lacticaseibacillus porcinae]|uniref:nucleoside-diphosphate kinase n=1 Tax=Lacticaseibacillus porcinae TaxID=1123687 RepID=UPI000F78B47E|nr:nucleoside-diphosphate kinase [Lacticaseibacillus porcinae]
MSEESTLILVKPDGVKAGHIGEVITRLENRRFTITALKVIQATPALLQAHYAQLVDKPFYPGIETFMMETPMVAIVATGTDVIESFRKMAGPTKPEDAMPGTIRGDFARAWGQQPIKNVVHSSDSLESAEREIKIWFPEL